MKTKLEKFEFDSYQYSGKKRKTQQTTILYFYSFVII